MPFLGLGPNPGNGPERPAGRVIIPTFSDLARLCSFDALSISPTQVSTSAQMHVAYRTDAGEPRDQPAVCGLAGRQPHTRISERP